MTPRRITVLIRCWLHMRGEKEKKNCESHGSFSRNLQVSAGTQAQLPAFSLVESQASPSPRVLQAFYWLIKYRILLFSHSQVRCAVRTESLMRTGIADTRASFAPRSPASLFPPASHSLYYHHRMHGNERREALFIKPQTAIHNSKGVFSACVCEIKSLKHASYPMTDKVDYNEEKRPRGLK